jgi:hypothetical protein
MLEIGQATPIVVRWDGDRFVLVEGLHRLEACKALGEETIVGFLASGQSNKAPSRYDDEADVVRQKTERLRALRLAKEAGEKRHRSPAPLSTLWPMPLTISEIEMPLPPVLRVTVNSVGI